MLKSTNTLINLVGLRLLSRETIELYAMIQIFKYDFSNCSPVGNLVTRVSHLLALLGDSGNQVDQWVLKCQSSLRPKHDPQEQSLTQESCGGWQMTSGWGSFFGR